MEFLIDFMVTGAGLLILLAITLAIFAPGTFVDVAEYAVRLVFGKLLESMMQSMSKKKVGPVGRFVGFLLTIGFFLWFYRFYSPGFN